MFLRRVPCDWSVASNDLVKLGFDEQHGVGDIVAYFVELGG